MEESEHVLEIRGNFSWGLTPKFERAEKQKIILEIKEKQENEEQKKASWLSRSFASLLPSYQEKSFRDMPIPFEPRTLSSTLGLQKLDLKVKKGSFVVIIGETGSGKSSLLQAIAGEMIYVPETTF